MVCPPPVTVCCTFEVPPVAANSVIAIDNCGSSVTVTHVGDVISNQICTNNYTLTRTYRAVDGCGNSTTCAQIIIVKDIIAPVFSTPPQNVVVDCGPNNLAQYQNWLNTHGGAVATDYCNTTFMWSYTVSNGVGQCGNTFKRYVKFTVKDDCGNRATKIASFTVVDMTPPVFVVPAQDLTVECSEDDQTGEASYYEWLDNRAGSQVVENCGVAKLEYHLSNEVKGCGHSWSRTVVFTAIDECLNLSQDAATFSFVDHTPPVIVSCAPDMTVECTEDVSLPAPQDVNAYDVCGQATVTLASTDVKGYGCEKDPMYVTYTYAATDECGNVSTCNQQITVIDDTPPTLNCQDTIDVICVNDLPTENEAVVLITQLVSSDNCDNFLCVILGSYSTSPNSITFEAMLKDACGNVAPPCSITFIATGGCKPLCSGTQDDWGNPTTMINGFSTLNMITEYINDNGNLVAGRVNKTVEAATPACVLSMLPGGPNTNQLGLGHYIGNISNGCDPGGNTINADGTLKNAVAGSVMALKLNIWFNLKHNQRNLGIQNLNNMPDCIADDLILERLGVHKTVYDVARLADDYLSGVGAFPPHFGESILNTLKRLNKFFIGCGVNDPCQDGFAPESRSVSYSGIDNIEIAPNPSTGTFMLTFMSEEEGKVVVKLVSPNGVVNERILTVAAGLNRTQLSFEKVPSGVYSLLLQTSTGTVSQRIVIVKD
jgi:hypothetical protein